jgi:Tfp pilus assembly protein PilW
MTMKVHQKQFGLTLIEIMIALVLGILLMGAVITIFITTVKSSSENIRMVHLNQELRLLMGLMSDELKRAGYSGAPDNRDFMDALNWDLGSNCLRYAYDVNGDGILQPNDESFAFQYVTDSALVRWGRGVTAVDCTDGDWNPISNPATAQIDDFTITDIVATALTVEVHTLEVSITGSVRLVPGRATRTISETIRVRNDSVTSGT